METAWEHSRLSDLEGLRALVTAPPDPVDLAWTKQVCICTRRLVHAFVISPVEQGRMKEVRDLIDRAIRAVAPAAASSKDMTEHLNNIQCRRDVIDSLLYGKTIIPLGL
jgi:hypothetical protein